MAAPAIRAMGRLRAEVERLHLKLDMLPMAELTSAWQSLDGAGHATGRTGWAPAWAIKPARRQDSSQ